MGKTAEADLVDAILFAVGNCHDDSVLWGHMRRDPDAFRRAVQHVLRTRGIVISRAPSYHLTRVRGIEYVLVHEDGGLCQGVALDDGQCPACGIIPDGQSLGLWLPKDAKMLSAGHIVPFRIGRPT